MSAATDIEVMRVLVLSTGHVKPETMNVLESRDCEWPPTYRGEFGIIVWAAMERGNPDNDTLPPDLQTVVDFAIDHGCEWVRLDADGPIINALPDHSEAWS